MIMKTLDSIPIDLVLHILSRLSAKSVARCRCVSKLWLSMLFGSPYFNELFLTMSRARPRLVFALKQDGEWIFFSTPNPQNPYEKSPRVATAKYHAKLSGPKNREVCCHASGLIYFANRLKDTELEGVVCNPITGHYAVLPKLKTYGQLMCFFGFDPVEKEFKVLFKNNLFVNKTAFRILTLGEGDMRWRRIQCQFPHVASYSSLSICIDGVLYYAAVYNSEVADVVVCFDVRSEKFKFIDAKHVLCQDSLCFVDYMGKLGAISCEVNKDLVIWILEDAEKRKWSKCVYSLPSYLAPRLFLDIFSMAGVTATGEIVFSGCYLSKSFYVVYINPQRSTFQLVEIQGIVATEARLEVIVDHVEILMLTNRPTIP